ncbi:MAG TPA: ATP synthase F1 subunit epsilon [Abditibacteriaceae bacterium]|jgi:F-type H+-transporting ATPase subunit epsilon
MAGTFSLQVVTPEREVYAGEVEQISVPGSEAPFGVLRNHAPIIAALDAGVIKIFTPEGQELRFVIGGGFFQMSDNKAQVLADSAEPPNEIDLARAEASEARARQRLGGQLETGLEMQRDRAERALKRARVRINASR